MSVVVQAKCPGCKKTLRIPSDWLQQAFRCKHCSMVIQAQKKAAQTPKPVKPAAKAAARPRVVPQAPPAAVQAPSAAPVAVPTQPSAPPVASVAPQVAVPVAQTQQGTFNNIDDDGENDVYRPSELVRRRSGSRGMGWKGYSVLFTVLLGIGAGFYFVVWPRIQAKLEDNNNPSGYAKNKDKKKKPRVDPTKDNRPPVQSKDDTQKPPVKKDQTAPPKDRTTTKPPVTPGGRPMTGAFPRRALVVSIHNYLYMNPTHFGTFENTGSRNIRTLLGRLNRRESFRIAPDQINHLSDVANDPRPPIKSVVTKTIHDYLASCRKQDRIILMFAGRCAEVDEKPYLVPIEGDTEDASTLIPLEWVYKEMAECKASQKVLILDVCRFNPDRGQERPGGDPMTEEFDKALQNPPKGVQVWSSCVAGQQSYEFDYEPVNNSVFIDALFRVTNRGVQGKIQRHDDLIPIKEMVAMVNKEMRSELAPMKLTQVSRLSGEAPMDLASFDPKEPRPATPKLADPPMAGDLAESRVVKGVLSEVSVPPIKPTETEGLLKYESLPPIPAKLMEQYPIDNTPSKLRDAVKHAQALLWAISSVPPPKELAAQVEEIREQEGIKYTLSALRNGYRAPAAAAVERFKGRVLEDEGKLTRIIRLLKEEINDYLLAPEIVEEREDEKLSKRWQANYDFILARVRAQYAFVFEYQSMLGSMRKELPERDPNVHNGWRLASLTRLKGDREGKKAHRAAKKLLESLIDDHKGTPWGILSKREKLTSLGLKWVATK